MSKRLVPRIAPSILSADFNHLQRSCAHVLTATDTLHLDVMDGHYVPNLTIGPAIISALRTAFPRPNTFFDCHLMVQDIQKWIEPFHKAGADQISFHVETVPDPQVIIDAIHQRGMRASLVLSPDIPVDRVFPYLDRIDQVLVMTVYPGFGGQKFMATCLDKVRVLREKMPLLEIQVDGGLDTDTVHEAAKAGANGIVAGTAIFSAKDPLLVIQQLRDTVQHYLDLKQ